MKTVLSNIAGIVKIDAPGNVPNICFISFSSKILDLNSPGSRSPVQPVGKTYHSVNPV